MEFSIKGLDLYILVTARFLSHNPEWLGQTLGAGLAPESEEQGAGVGAQVGSFSVQICLIRLRTEQPFFELCLKGTEHHLNSLYKPG